MTMATVSGQAARPPLPAPPPRAVRLLRRLKVGRRLLITGTLTLFTVFTLFPFVWMALTSLRTGSDLYRVADRPFSVSGLTLDHFRELLTETKFLTWTLNSLIVALSASAIALVIGVPAAYSLGRLRYRGGAVVGVVVFSTYLLPPALLFIPMNVVVNRLHLGNTLGALILVYLTFLVPFIAWMLSSYFQSLPVELAEAARIDGASRLRAMMVIDLPLVLPGVVSVFFFAFTLCWQEYLYALTFVRSADKQPVAVGLVNALQVGDVFAWGQLMGGALLGALPVVIIFSFLMDYYLSGLTAGAVKG
ncbi:carbohydrate ABC transporter permease [Micromonospora marina]|uniref:carbohydrate ABC transporter permease n=1 Tax=Micromonospora marina TaxID=307120 RepID=UPI003D73A4D6